MAGRGIYFACDNNPRVLYQLGTCVRSIRQCGCRLPIDVVMVGPAPRQTAELLSAHSVRLIARSWKDYPAYLRRQPTFLKWAALAEDFPYDELLFLDADTYAFRDPQELLDAVGPEDIHARPSYQAMETAELTTRGLLLIGPPGALPSYLRRYETLRGQLGVERFLGLNSGIMVFKNGSHRRLARHPELFRTVRRMFWGGVLPYPMPMRMAVMDEVVSRLAIGLLGGFTGKEIPEDLCPYYIDCHFALGAAPAILTHTFGGQYAHFLFTRFGREACQAYLNVERHAGGGTPLRFLARWAWIAFIHGSGLTRIGSRWKCAWARRALERLVAEEHAVAENQACAPGCPRAAKRECRTQPAFAEPKSRSFRGVEA